ncbi:MAG: helix-turn-helix domain-containing protein [Oscillospiraceae bacterium]|nr:helix-turn-helix domain-containing protein [Oscillospiraceae bacterium]
MANKVGPLIKEARTGAKLTQEQLAKKIAGLTAADVSKAERGEIELSQAQLKAIAKATGVTQASLLNAAKEGSKPSAAKKTAAKKPAAKKEEELKLTAAEKKLVELYRAADKTAKETAVKVLKGEKTTADGILGTILGGAVDLLSGKK